MSKKLCKANDFVRSAAIQREYRPMYHAAPPAGWINDPNGFCFYNGEYHLFCQYYPYEPTNKVIYWGHFKSADLVRWEFVNVALAPDCAYDADGVWSGTALVEDGRVSLIYTGRSFDADGNEHQQQCIAYSDDGVTFTKDGGNPIIATDALPPGCNPVDFRDPKLFKRGDTYFCLTVAVDVGGFGKLLLFKSADAKAWEYFSTPLSGEDMNLGTLWECPDYFELGGKDVLIFSTVNAAPRGEKFNSINAAVYAIGVMDWENGAFDCEYIDTLDDGNDFYAPQTTLDGEGRRIITAWQNCWNRTNVTADLGLNWSGCMTLPRVLTLSGDVIQQRPVDVSKNFFVKTATALQTVSAKWQSIDSISGDCCVLNIDAELRDCASFAVRLLADGDEYVSVTYDKERGLVTLNRAKSGHEISGGELAEGAANIAASNVGADLERLRMEIWLDVSCIEIFFPDTGRAITSRAFTKRCGSGIAFFADGAAVVSVCLKHNDLTRT